MFTGSAIEWFKIQTPRTIGITSTGRIFDNAPTNPEHYCYPSLAVNKNGDIVIGFSASSDNDRIAACYWGKLNNGKSLLTPVCYFPGRVFSPVTSMPGGDYSYTTLDPSDQLRIWTIQMYAETNTTTYVWGTAFAPVNPY